MKPKSKVYNHFTDTSANNKTSYKCNYCNTVYNFKNATKFVWHLLKCKATPKDVQDSFQQYNKNTHIQTTQSGVSQAQDSQEASSSQDSQAVTTAFMNKDDQMDIHQAVAKAIYVTCTPFTLFEHPLWKNAFHKVNPLYTPPSRKLLATSLLNKEYAETQTIITNKIQQSSVIHLAIDGWSNLRRESILNVILYAPKPYFYKFIETKYKRHTAEYLCEEVATIIEEVNASKLLAIITDNAANMVKFSKLINEKYNQTMWAGCLAHTLHLVIGDILQISKIRRMFSTTVNIIKTITQSHILGAEFRKIAEEKAIKVSLHLPVKTRWGSYLMSLQSFLKSKVILQNMIINDTTVKLRKYKNQILNENIWTQLQDLELLLKPIVEWIFILEGDYHAVHLVHKALNELHKLLNNSKTQELLEESLLSLQTKFEERKANALKPFHFAAAILDPNNQGIHLSCQENVDGCEALFNLYNPATPGAISDDILEDLSNYKTRKNNWEKDFVWKMAETTEPLMWWETLFPKTALGQTAIKILTIPATSAAVERSFSTFSNVHTKKRNRLVTSRAGKITFISHNWKLINSRSKSQNPHQRLPTTEPGNESPNNSDSESEDNFSDVSDENIQTVFADTRSTSNTDISILEIRDPLNTNTDSDSDII